LYFAFPTSSQDLLGEGCVSEQGHELLEFAREAVVVYLEDDDAVTRREAAVCCCHLVEHSSRVVELAATTPLVVNTRSGRTTGVGLRRRRLLIEEVGFSNPI
jgi:FKBP12-rapamycin complex-associated protein